MPADRALTMSDTRLAGTATSSARCWSRSAVPSGTVNVSNDLSKVDRRPSLRLGFAQSLIRSCAPAISSSLDAGFSAHAQPGS
jgi:hypothetical protein